MPNPVAPEANGSFHDNVAQATRVILVDTTGAEYTSGTAPTQRTGAVQRVTTATTTTVAAGAKYIAVTVLGASSLTSPTVGGVAIPTGGTATFTAPTGDTLAALAIVTLTGDDVLITTVV